jgi:hypothetical protein
MDGAAIEQKFAELNLLDDIPLYKWYLPPLHPNFEGAEGQELLRKYRSLAAGLRESPEFVQELIRDKNWRPTLIGITVVILLRAVEYQADMVWRLANWNWVAPQLAVGIAMVDQGRGINLIRGIVEEATETSNPKVVMSAYSALSFMNSPIAAEFESTPLFEHLTTADAWDGSMGIARRHWDFWNTIEPIQ